jgi:hypothetical protein
MEHKNIYALIFKATRTNQNGTEQRLTKTVLVEPFRNGIHITPEQQREIAESVLKEQHFYNLEYKETKVKTVY